MARYFLDTPCFNLLPASYYSDASDLWAASADRPLEERNEALIRFFEEKEKELKARTVYEGPVDEEDGGICNLDRGSEEPVQVSVKSEAGVANSSENRTKGGCRITSELLASLAQTILDEGLGTDNTVPSFEVMDADEDETAGGICKLLGPEKKHPRNERVQVSVEGEQEHKKVRIAESSWNEEPLQVGLTVDDS